MPSIWSLRELAALLLDSKSCSAGLSTHAEDLGCASHTLHCSPMAKGIT